MKMKYYLLIFTIIISCKKDKTETKPTGCAYDSFGEGRFVFAPDSVKVDSAIIIGQLFENHTACQISNGYSVQVNGNFREIKLKTIIDTCNCDNSQTGDTYRDYSFSSSSVGIQIVRTQTKPGSYEQDTIVVY